MIINPNEPVPVTLLLPEKAAQPKAIHLRCDFALDTRWEADLGNFFAQHKFGSLRSIWYDASACGSNAAIIFPETQQRIVLRAATQNYWPVLAVRGPRVIVEGAAPDVLQLALLNVDVEDIFT